jgi:hypothetical protein
MPPMASAQATTIEPVFEESSAEPPPSRVTPLDLEAPLAEALSLVIALIAVHESAQPNRDTVSFLAYEAKDRLVDLTAQWTTLYEATRH